ncbi:substrate-binding domain-containing protein [Kitasatospora sp. NPDC094015]|uniref:substrate-binding domain-containing protein n=1 Tax=Kitasatospora sp. NPDC094015 TaxID=3155205 RepID=UPI00331B3FB5
MSRALARTLILLTVLGLTGSSILLGAPRAAAEDYRRIGGAGSTWSFNAVDDWISNVKQYGMTIDFNPGGSSFGRSQFKNGSTDFAVTEIPYGLTDNGQVDAAPPWPMAYLPIVAGGTSFMYNLKIGGNRVTNLRLSGETVAKIFTGRITKWNDPQVQAENPSLKLPETPVRPVIRSDGSGTTAQLTTWFTKRYQQIWDDYCTRTSRGGPCGMTSFYPQVSGNNWPALGSSDGVAKTVANDRNDGTITYVEYSYALNARFPVVKLLNAAGYYIEPDGRNVSVALKHVQINPTDLTQQLDGVYDAPETTAYPLSSYSYMAVHTSAIGDFSPEKGHTLAAFGYYFLCEGQQKADKLGYSPLTPDLVRSGFQQLARIPGSEQRGFDAAKCNNPTFGAGGANPYADGAAKPQDCDKLGSATQCTTGTGGNKASTAASKGGTKTAGSTGTAATGGGTGGTAPAGSDGGAGTAGGVDGQAGAGGDPALTGGTDGGAGAGGGGQQYAADAVALSNASGNGLRHTVMVIAALLLGAVIVLPPVAAGRAARRARTAGSAEGEQR